MMKYYSLLILLVFVMVSSCNKETFKYYSFDIYPVKEVNNSGTWIETDFLSDEILSFQLNSLRILEEFHDFEAINISSCNFYADKNLIINTDTIWAGENLLKRLDSDLLFFAQHIGEFGTEYPWYYLIIKSTVNKKINLQSNYYQFNFKGKTQNGYEINDSLIVKYNNR